MQITFRIDKDTVQHSTPLKQKQRCNSLCRVSTSVPFETVHVHPKTAELKNDRVSCKKYVVIIKTPVKRLPLRTKTTHKPF